MPRNTHTFKKVTSNNKEYYDNKSSSNKPNSVTNYKNTNVPMINQPSTIFDSMKHGFGFGMGSSIAHSFFDSKPIIQPKLNLENMSCSIFSDQLIKCKTEDFCSNDFIKSLEDNLKKCENK